MCYYTYELDDDSSDFCAIVTPYGKFCYKQLPMRIKTIIDSAQEIIEEVFHGLDQCEVYIHEFGMFNNSWEEHLHSWDQVLKQLEDNGFKVNPLKCKRAVQETNWPDYWFTPVGLKPGKKNIDAILKMSAPQNVMQTWSFLGAVTFYHDMWLQCSHIVTSLTKLTGTGKFVWEPYPSPPGHL
jgi:hypothetical protein